jgi:hypothetical protein
MVWIQRDSFSEVHKGDVVKLNDWDSDYWVVTSKKLDPILQIPYLTIGIPGGSPAIGWLYEKQTKEKKPPPKLTIDSERPHFRWWFRSNKEHTVYPPFDVAAIHTQFSGWDNPAVSSSTRLDAESAKGRNMRVLVYKKEKK